MPMTPIETPINFCHIAPTAYLETVTPHNGAHLLLAHLVESDPVYAEYYANLDDGKYKIMDNSAFEMFKQGRPMYDPSKLIEMAKRCKAHCIVLPDYPKENWEKTVEAAKTHVDQVIAAGFETFFVPQSELGDLEGLIKSFEWAINEPKIDLIGVSILACPIALGVNEKKHSKRSKKRDDDAYLLQRFLSRWTVLRTLMKAGLLNDRANKRFHCLGMTDGPREIELLTPFSRWIFSWDSSAAVWTGLNGVAFDNSPTGLRNGKFEQEVDFNFKREDSNAERDVLMLENIAKLNMMIKKTRA